MINIISFYKSPGNVCRAPVCIHMIGTILCIIFQNKNSRLVPDRTFTQVFYEHANCQVVIGYMREWCGASFT